MSQERLIGIRGLEVFANVGLPDGERAQSQRLLIDLRFAGREQPADLHDDIARTVDYHAVSLRAASIAEAGSRRLLETLADELAAVLLAEFSLRWIEVTIRKFILPNTEWVSVTTRREAD